MQRLTLAPSLTEVKNGLWPKPTQVTETTTGHGHCSVPAPAPTAFNPLLCGPLGSFVPPLQGNMMLSSVVAHLGHAHHGSGTLSTHSERTQPYKSEVGLDSPASEGDNEHGGHIHPPVVFSPGPPGL